jgi:miniconductance mechanosensitive channel
MLTGFCILILVAILAYIIAKHVVVRGIRHLITKLKFANHDIMSQHSVIRRIANIVPAIVIMNGIVTVPHLSAKMVSFVQMAAQAFIFLTIALAIGELLNIFNLVLSKFCTVMVCNDISMTSPSAFRDGISIQSPIRTMS